ncbi:hypothetical protein U1Q18_011186 [Sarracenia purpurea var. burkii]
MPDKTFTEIASKNLIDQGAVCDVPLDKRNPAPNRNLFRLIFPLHVDLLHWYPKKNPLVPSLIFSFWLNPRFTPNRTLINSKNCYAPPLCAPATPVASGFTGSLVRKSRRTVLVCGFSSACEAFRLGFRRCACNSGETHLRSATKTSVVPSG